MRQLFAGDDTFEAEAAGHIACRALILWTKWLESKFKKNGAG